MKLCKSKHWQHNGNKNLNFHLKIFIRVSFLSRLHHFFQKMKKWLDMINLGSGMFRERIEMLEKNFHVTSIVFKKTEEVFYTVFKDSDGSQSRTNKARARK